MATYDPSISRRHDRGSKRKHKTGWGAFHARRFAAIDYAPVIGVTIKVKRGLQANLPSLNDGEPAITVDNVPGSISFWIGYLGTNFLVAKSGNVSVNNQGSFWSNY